MLVGYRYRIYPTPEQERVLAQTFGCVRWVFNEYLRIRNGAFEAGEQITENDVQRRAVTVAKQQPETAWLSDVSSVALVQSVRDAHRAYRNWFSTMGRVGVRKKYGKPRFKTRRGRQTFRLPSNNGFRLRGSGNACRLYIPKAGEVRVEWSRALPSVPSSVTVIREPDGRYYASFTVEREATPLPPVQRRAGIDLGLTSFAVIAYSDGGTETVANPRHLRSAQRRLARAQRALSRKEKGSANRRKAARVVAVRHRKVREKRADHHHNLALRLIRENQAVAIEDLAVSVLARSRIAGSVQDAAWSTFTRFLREKAGRYGRQIATVGRFEPTSQVCSACGIRSGPSGQGSLGIREWTCSGCGAMHDRDVNAARNILVAAGLAETLNACGGDVRPGFGQADPSEAGTRRGAA